jgi:UDP-2,4-diacetamido-2,4,6-trideoxy-beta-L-altropyranose hydrolase
MRVLLRADASPTIGTGHVMRCLALAEALRARDAHVRLACADLTDALALRLSHHQITVERLAVEPASAGDLSATVAAAGATGDEWVVLDGYRFDTNFHAGLRSRGLRTLIFDDGGRLPAYEADIVVNANLYADPAWYRERRPDTRLLLGPRYAPLRGEFDAWRTWERPHRDVARRLLVTLGGADPRNATRYVLDAIAMIDPPLEAVIVVGGSNPHAATLAEPARRLNARLVVDPTEMPRLLAEAELAIASGGTTALELAFMGLPALLLVAAENQRRAVGAFVAAGVAEAVADPDPAIIAERVGALANERRAREEMSRRGRELVDGGGAARVARAMAATTEIALVPAGPEHRRLVWEWANDPTTRRSSFTSSPIPWDDHVRWYDERLRRDRPDLFIVVDRRSEPIGQVRLEIHDGRGRMPINLAPSYRGHGYGSLIIDAGSNRLLDEPEVEAIDVYVRPDNEASIKAFRSADFTDAGMVMKDGQHVLRLERRRDVLPVARA